MQCGVLLFCTYTLTSCNKKFLEENPNTQIIVPNTLKDFQQLMDRDNIINEMPELGELSSDNYYLPSSYWENLPPKERNSYIWASDLYEGQGNVPDWNFPYQQIFYANIVLEGLSNVAQTDQNQKEWNVMKGRAHFVRGFAFYNLAQIFAPVYDKNSSHKVSGIPLKLQADINVGAKQSTIQETYDQILSDLFIASTLLPANVDNKNLNRPTKPAVYAQIARTYLSMQEYDQALLYADSCLQLNNYLLDYNTLDQTASNPFPSINNEVLYQGFMNNESRVLIFWAYPEVHVDSVLYQSYVTNDLRKKIFFELNDQSIANGRSGYAGYAINTCFGGLATDEMFLIRAECEARKRDVSKAISDLNTLLRKRYVTGEYTDYPPTTPEDALSIILQERRKELVFRGLRWSDLRRLNKEGANIILKRQIKGQEYLLLPGNANYTFPVPPDENVK